MHFGSACHLLVILSTFMIIGALNPSSANSQNTSNIDTYPESIGAYVRKRADKIGASSAVQLGINRCKKWTTGLNREEIAEAERYIRVQAMNAACRETPNAPSCR